MSRRLFFISRLGNIYIQLKAGALDFHCAPEHQSLYTVKSFLDLKALSHS